MSGLFKKHGHALVANGYSIVPIPIGRKGPAVEDWQTNPAKTPEAVDNLAAEHPKDGVGILTRETPAVDIDCYDQDIVDQMVEWCNDNIGEAPLRVGKAPKALLLFAAGEIFPKVTSARYYDPSRPDLDPKKKGQRVEVLADGQQFVAYHIHPETGRPYEWLTDWNSPLDTEVLDLPMITAEHARLACREFERLAEEAGWERLGDGSATAAATTDPDDALGELDPPEETEAEVERVRSALKAIEGDVASTYDYDQWRNVLFALKWTRWECAESLARTWSESSDKHVTKEFNVVWRGAQKRDRGREITLGSVFKLAKDQGWDASRSISEAEIAATFEKLMGLVAELKDTDNTRKAVQDIIDQMAPVPMSTTAEGELLKAIKLATGFTIGDMRRDLAKARKAHAKEESFMATHAGYAGNMINRLEEKSSVKPIGVEGMIYVYSESKGIWRGTQRDDFAVQVAEAFDGQDNCSRRTDYLAIAAHAYSMISASNQDFFNEAPVGLACKGRFYTINKAGAIEREELDHTHRQRILAPVVPKVGPMPMFERFLAETFAGDETNDQVLLLQEVMGAIMLGLMARYEKVVMLKGSGRSGKGTIMKIIERLVPQDARTAVSPFNWDGEYYLANLAGKRLNVVGELPDDEPIPAAQFKTVIGRDSLTGRSPSQKPFTFRNEAAHVFNSNYFIYTKDHSEAFYSRWILMEFRNSLIGHEDKQIKTLAEDIIEKELAQVLAWALQGAKRLQERGYFQTTQAHKKLMGQWRHRTSTLLEFLLDKDVCHLSSKTGTFCRRQEFYGKYVLWCKESNRRPMGKMKLYDELENVGGSVGVKQTRIDGYDVIRGVTFDSAYWVVGEDDDW